MKRRTFSNYSFATSVALLSILLSATAALGQGTSFRYQGRLTDGGSPANGNYDLQFALWDSASGGAQIGATLTFSSVAVSNGIFSVSLDFGASSFDGANRFLEINARPLSNAAFAPLSPRQPLTATNQKSEVSVNVDDTLGGTLPAAQFNIGGNPVLSVSGGDFSSNTNTFLGVGAGAADTPDPNGNCAGRVNSFFGFNTGKANTIGCANSFFGGTAGLLNISGNFNAFFGHAAGLSNTEGGGNSFFGDEAGLANTTGLGNSVFGQAAGQHNLTGTRITLVGQATDVGTDGLVNATAVGFRALVNQSNSLVLGSIYGINGSTAATQVGIGTTTPSNLLDVTDVAMTSGDPGITIQSVPGLGVADLGLRIMNRAAFGNEWYLDSTGNGSTYGAGNLAFAIRGSAKAAMIIHPSGSIELTHLGTAGGTSLCLNGQNVIAACSSSLRYKTNVASFSGGLNIINHLRPISFTWKQDGTKDIGFGAEEVEQVAPLFTFRNDQGEIEGVRYDRLSVLFVNAFKEQQAEIEMQQEQIKRQQAQMSEQQAALRAQQQQLHEFKKLICRGKKTRPCHWS